MNENYLSILSNEFSAGEGSFMLQLRVDHKWDKDAFNRLTNAMRKCCEQYQYTQGQLDQWKRDVEQLTVEQLADEQIGYEMTVKHKSTDLPRWLAEGFWFTSHFVKDWTSHAAWEKDRAREPEYFDKAYEHLYMLASWFFEGKS